MWCMICNYTIHINRQAQNIKQVSLWWWSIPPIRANFRSLILGIPGNSNNQLLLQSWHRRNYTHGNVSNFSMIFLTTVFMRNVWELITKHGWYGTSVATSNQFLPMTHFPWWIHFLSSSMSIEYVWEGRPTNLFFPAHVYIMIFVVYLFSCSSNNQCAGGYNGKGRTLWRVYPVYLAL